MLFNTETLLFPAGGIGLGIEKIGSFDLPLDALTFKLPVGLFQNPLYDDYFFICENVTPGLANRDFFFRTVDDAQAVNGGANYARIESVKLDNQTAENTAGSLTNVNCNVSSINDIQAADSLSAWFSMYHPRGTPELPLAEGESQYLRLDGAITVWCRWGCQFTVGIPINTLEFGKSGADFWTAGTIHVYGMGTAGALNP